MRAAVEGAPGIVEARIACVVTVAHSASFA